MNIFVLSLCPMLCAKMHCDKHVVKMITEYGQLLSTCHHMMSSSPSNLLFKKCFPKHPCSIWLRESSANYIWLYQLFCCLCREYTYRYGKIHKTETRLKILLNEIPDLLPDEPMTVFRQAMPDNLKLKNPILAYHSYYRHSKRHIANWSGRNVPWWYY
jgi:hypothetical protein